MIVDSTLVIVGKAIYHAEIVDPFDLHERLGLSPSHLLRWFAFYARIGIIEPIGDGRYKVLPSAREFLWQRRFKLLVNPDRSWVPRERKALTAGALYMPDLRRVERDFFINLVERPRKSDNDCGE